MCQKIAWHYMEPIDTSEAFGLTEMFKPKVNKQKNFIKGAKMFKKVDSTIGAIADAAEAQLQAKVTFIIGMKTIEHFEFFKN